MGGKGGDGNGGRNGGRGDGERSLQQNGGSSNAPSMTNRPWDQPGMRCHQEEVCLFAEEMEGVRIQRLLRVLPWALVGILIIVLICCRCKHKKDMEKQKVFLTQQINVPPGEPTPVVGLPAHAQGRGDMELKQNNMV